jgi:MFS transporter, SP family, arabinose:H+ symporter
MTVVAASELAEQEQPGSFYVYLISAVAALGGLLMGYHLVIIGAAIIFLKTAFDLSPVAIGFAVSSAAIGCVVGPAVAGSLGERIGRKWTLAIAGCFFGAAAVGTAFAGNLVQFNAFRILGGLGVGIASVSSPMYLAEVAPARIRGRLVTCYQLAVVTGGLASIVVSYWLAPSGNWRWMFAAQVIPSCALLFGLLLAPESPRWLVEKGRQPEALRIMTRISGSREAEIEIEAISRSLAVPGETGRMSELFRPGTRVALLIAVSLAVLQQWTGAGTLFLYAPVIFQKAGFYKAQDALMQTILLNVWNLICTLVAFWLVDRVGRRPLLLTGIAGMAAGFVGMGAVFKFGLSGGYVLGIMLVCVGTYAISLGPLPWLIMSEIFPTRLRGKAMAIGSLSVWLALFVANQAFPPLVSDLEKKFGTPALAFWVFAAVCCVAFVFAWQMVPETKGKTLEEIARSWTPADDRRIRSQA